MLELRNITPDEFERWMSTESRAHGNRLNHGSKLLPAQFGRPLIVVDAISMARYP